MGKPVRSRTKAAALLGVSVVLLTIAWLPPTGGLKTLVVTIGLTGLTFGALWLARHWNGAHHSANGHRGRGVIARWTINAARWEWFCRESRTWDLRPEARPNQVNLAQSVGPAGIPVIVTHDAVLVGQDMHALEKNTVVDLQADWIEFTQAGDDPNNRTAPLTLRVPLATARQAEGELVAAAYRSISE